MSSNLSTRIEVLGAALSCFGEVGFAATTQRAIAARAGVPVEVVFEHYPTKHAFALAVYRSIIADLGERVADLPTGTVAARFVALMRAKLDLLDTRRAAVRSLVAAAIDADGPSGVLSDGTAAVRAQMAAMVYTTVAGRGRTRDR